MSRYREPYDPRPPAPTLHEDARPAPKLLYGPRGEVLAAVPAKRRPPFGFQANGHPRSSEASSTVGAPDTPLERGAP